MLFTIYYFYIKHQPSKKSILIIQYSKCNEPVRWTSEGNSVIPWHTVVFYQHSNVQQYHINVGDIPVDTINTTYSAVLRHHESLSFECVFKHCDFKNK